MARLPLELQFQILDQFSDDKLELRHLCNVSRAWGAHSQRLIFRDVWVTYATAERLLLLFRRRPQLGIYVKSLTIVEIKIFDCANRPQRTLEGIVDHLPSLMPNVRTLDIIGRRFDAHIEYLEFLSHKLAGITHLRLRSQTFKNPHTMLCFIGLFPRLKQLEILGGYTAIASPAILPPPPRRHLKYLALGRIFCCGTAMGWLARRPIAVDELYIKSWGHDDHEKLNSFLRQIGDGLQHLRLKETRTRYPGAKVFLPPCPSLRTLDINLRYSTADRDSMAAGLLSILQYLSSAPISSMYFETAVGYTSNSFLDLQWDQVDVEMTAFCDLEDVVFDLWEAVWGGAISDVLGANDNHNYLLAHLPIFPVAFGFPSVTILDDDAQNWLAFGSRKAGRPVQAARTNDKLDGAQGKEWRAVHQFNEFSEWRPQINVGQAPVDYRNKCRNVVHDLGRQGREHGADPRIRLLVGSEAKPQGVVDFQLEPGLPCVIEFQVVQIASEKTQVSGDGGYESVRCK
ncbi:hypothetical protein C8R47DRAFT_1201135 [Mycena vitilis]|nr:hypothetical protein C8R47DRAFT_1201135 [Mycena vitilis]